MTSVYRTKDGGRIQRGKPLRFTFDGRALQGVEGDTLASALLANGIHLVGRSFKYHRPRGILSAGVDGVKVGEAVACAILGLPLPSSGARGSGGAA